MSEEQRKVLAITQHTFIHIHCARAHGLTRAPTPHPHHLYPPYPQRPDLSEEQRKVLQIMERTFKCYITEDPRAAELKEKLNRWAFVYVYDNELFTHVLRDG